ncbi:MAG: LytR C-terminal domain-containing protein [Gaiellaceae bacterium]
MDHPLPVPDALIRPWRTAAYIAAAIAAVELFLLLVIGGGALVGTVSDRLELAAQERVLAPPARQTTPATRKPAVAAVAKVPRSRTVVMVLNGNGRTGAAAAAASRVQSRGYKVGTVGNAPRQVSRSLVMYKPSFAGEGKRLGSDLGVKLVVPLDGMRAGELGRAHVVFILGS